MTARGPVGLHELLGPESGLPLDALHVPALDRTVQDLVLVAEVDQINATLPDTVIVLGAAAAGGGWMVSIAVRYAWERRAAAVIVPDRSLSATVIELARRFDVGLYASRESAARTAVLVARELGAREVGVLTRLDELAARTRAARSLDQCVALLSDALGQARVEVVSGGVVLAAAGTEPPDPSRIEVDVSADSRSGTSLLVALVTDREAELADRALHLTAATARAFLLGTELAQIRAAAPLLTATALTGTDIDRFLSDPRGGSAAISWPATGPYRVVCLHADAPEAHLDRIGPAVYATWGRAFPGIPLARIHQGWLGFLPGDEEWSAVAADVDERIGRALGRAGIAVGLSRVGEGAPPLISEAWLAARTATPAAGAIVFDRLTVAALRRVLPRTDAAVLAAGWFPDLVADPHADEIMAGVVAYLDCGANVTAAAERLHVHRNTLQTRLRRAQALGIDLADPESLLGTHLVLVAYLRGNHR